MATVLLDGVGAVGIRAARQLVDTPGLDKLLITARGSAPAALRRHPAAAAEAQHTGDEAGQPERHQRSTEEPHQRLARRGAEWNRTIDLILIRDAL